MESIVPFDIHNEIKEILIISFISYNQEYPDTVGICCTFINGTQIPVRYSNTGASETIRERWKLYFTVS